uniref:Uncharacterized protein n=1 Tax=Anguilla anguilla TaxID=7936 RepID=A0A0E9VR39_ANGAN
MALWEWRVQTRSEGISEAGSGGKEREKDGAETVASIGSSEWTMSSRKGSSGQWQYWIRHVDYNILNYFFMLLLETPTLLQ